MRAVKHIILLLFAWQVACHAQTDSLKKRPLLKLYSGSMNFGVYEFTNYNLGRQDLQTLNPGNQLLKKDISAYKYDGNNRQYEGFCIGSNLSVIFYNKKKQAYSNRHELHVGISYQSNEKLEHNYILDERVPFDTLKSNTSPNIYYIDTTKTSRYYYSNYRDNILFNITYTFHTRQNRIFSAYIGYSLCYGRVINNITTAEYLYTEGYEDQNHFSYNYAPGKQDYIKLSEQSVTHKGNIFQAAVPIGGLVRFSNVRKNFVKKLALNVETRTGAQLTQIPGTNSIIQFFFNANFGIKYYFCREAIH
jgi:hypothetical protein